MNVQLNPLDELLSSLRQYFQNDSIDRQDAREKSPLRSEIFSIEQMEQHAHHIAREHKISYKDSREQLLKRLAENEEVLIHVTGLLQNAVRQKTPITPAGEWLLDNFYLLEEQIQLGKRYLPKGYSKGLPKLITGSLSGYPRVYDIVVQIISHSDGRVDIHALNSFISAYQKITELTLGELWAVPIMLRLALIENLRRVAARIALDRIDADLAHQWADQIIHTSESDPKNLILTIADMARSNPPMESAFVAEFYRKLQWKGTTLALPISWIEQQLSENNLTINAMVLAENQKQAADQVSIINSINSLRFLAKLDWREFVEAISVVEQTLHEDIDDIYPNMDFFTRDRCRHQIEKISRQSFCSENEVARIAINLAKESTEKNKQDKRKSHVGYYLIGAGKELTEKRSGQIPPFIEQVKNFFCRSAGKVYAIGLIFITVAVSVSLVAKAHADGVGSPLLIFLMLLTLLAGSYLASALVNWFATLWAGPEPLPKMNFSHGIPQRARTLVVVPSILSNLQHAEKLVDDLEVRFLANRDPNLLFALLTDLCDANEQTLSEDEALITCIKNRTLELNEKYGSNSFFLFHRPRQWNAKEKVWMGYERKRGKLTELNHLLRGRAKKRFSVVIGEEQFYTTVKYVITLDTDTQLPREAAWKLVGLMEHPLNQPLYSEDKKRVIDGYGIIQPRIAISLHGATRSLYSGMNENDSGIDPYTRLTSDVYQDVFSEGSFIGKGIYHIDAFEQALNDRFPENRILSHDLLEGSYARCGFASDVQFYEETPSRYSTDISRRYRWIRGDWQIGNWFLPFVPHSDGKLQKNPLSALSRWKIFDNLRRSIVPIAFTLLLISGWTLLPTPWLWTLCVVAIVIVPSLLISAWSLIHIPKEIPFVRHIKNVVHDTYKTINQAVFMLMCMPYEAFISVTAIVRTFWRVGISRRHLLEWSSSGSVYRQHENQFFIYRKMWINPLLTLLITPYLAWVSPTTLVIALPFLVLWFIAPSIAWWMSRPLPVYKTPVTYEQKLYLREVARKTWTFFENLVSVEDNWLPPDNLQQYPTLVIAHRTSPTNIGLALLANLSAHDFGYITTTQFLERTANTLQTVGKLERYHGHFYNWYDTQSLSILSPRYISTVDSGNLAGHLLTLRQGLLKLADEKIIDEKLKYGLHDTIRIIAKTLPLQEQSVFTGFQKYFEDTKHIELLSLRQIRNYLEDMLDQFAILIDGLTLNSRSEAYEWMQALERQLKNALHEVAFLEPWLTLQSSGKSSTLIDLPGIPTWRELKEIKEVLPAWLRLQHTSENSKEAQEWLTNHQVQFHELSKYATGRIHTMELLASQCFEFADIEYDFMYDKSQHLLSIGYTVDNLHRDASYYDLLASESRLASFVAVAQGKLPQESWFALSRRLTTAGNTPTLLSWSGSMFEYLMPLLVMPTYENTLLDETYKGTVVKQIEYGKQNHMPWGISESCYNVVDVHHNYQYRAFGVPELGFKRGLDKDFVVAPYATLLALMVDPAAACANLEKLRTSGYEGQYGFFEAIDFTPARLPNSKTPALIHSFMAHHQGMSLLALDHLLNDQPMQKRFSADPQFQTALLLLQERVPKTTAFYSGSVNTEEIVHLSAEGEVRTIINVNIPVPEVQLLSNGNYHVMMTHTGAGYSRWKDTALTRWREDTIRDHWGTFCYIRNLDTSEFWSATYQPTLKEAKHYEAIFSQGRVEFRRRDQDLETHTEIVVSPEDNIEIRRVHLTNHATTALKIELTSYGEVVLALPIADASHPAFSNLFVQTEIITHQNAILCTRRPRSSDERPLWMFHLMKVDDTATNFISYETDRMKFIGRGSSIVHPQVMDTIAPLSGSQGSVLDPIVSIQYRITIEPGETAMVDMLSGIAETRTGVQALVDKYQDRHLRDRAFDLSWTHSQVVLRQINTTESQAQLYGRLAGSVIYANPALRANPDILSRNHRGQSALWSYSISGDLPIVLLLISDSVNISLAKQLIQARAYWQLKGLAVDLVILNDDPSGYRQVLQEQIQQLITGSAGISSGDRQGGVFVRSVDQLSTEDYILFQTVARAIISDSRGSLAEQLSRKAGSKKILPELIPTHVYKPVQNKKAISKDLQFYNGLGGFSADGREYVIITDEKNSTPLPWVNVLANKNFGSVITESGPCYTWSENAHAYRLTPWSNDPVTDNSGEAMYLRDEESGYYWSPTPWPAKGKSPYVTRHGFGYTIFEHEEDGIITEVITYVDLEAPIKFTTLKIRNESGRPRKLSLTSYTELVLGSLRPSLSMHTVTEVDADSGAIMARNSYNTDFPDRVAFIHTDDRSFSVTCDRKEFVGRNGTLQSPKGMKQATLSGKSGASLDPCMVVQIPIELSPDQERIITVRLGAGKDAQEARGIMRQFRGVEAASRALDNVRGFWKKTLGSIQVETPDASLNILTNGWLLYQVLACRSWGRSGFYQSGGAFGFRDQLQDALALIHTKPALTRDHILLSASRQFPEGDVQHWWHPPFNRGVRTLCSDDFLWLPYVTSRYVIVTGDKLILNESVAFIDGRPLNAHEESYYDLPAISSKQASLYDHCKLSIQRALRFGTHGLPLMGSGDWNDGMNMVGIEGRGESVWLGFFLYDVLMRFSIIARIKEDEGFVQECEQQAKNLKENLNKNGWDGDWYIRAYFDDGMILGSAGNEECKIDSISQSWSVLSGAGEPKRSITAMMSVDNHLVNREKALIQLLDPPFNTSSLNPGYIKGYVPGVRENGGQYTHAAIWMVMAFTKLGDHRRTWELLNMINPVHHGKSPETVETYKVEPYVVAADVYGVSPHIGRGGWTWYTGSAGWMYQLIVESFLGLKRAGNVLRFEPCIPADWKSFSIHYSFGKSVYHIDVLQSAESKLSVTLDGLLLTDQYVALVDDEQDHTISVSCKASRVNAL